MRRGLLREACNSMIECLPSDWRVATLVGRIDVGQGPTPVVVRAGRVIDVSRTAPTVSQLLNCWDSKSDGVDLGNIESFECSAAWDRPARHRLLPPIDLQSIKAAGVTFAVSALERVIEERAGGDASKAKAIRDSLSARVGAEAISVRPGSSEALRLKDALIADGVWSQYLEVAIGPDAEVFTKAQPLSSVGWGDFAAIRSDSHWNNPEPEIVLACDRNGRVLGATLGNDVNLRDFEGRSALLLGKAKDNNASCALGPFIRLFDDSFTLDDVRRAEVRLEVSGTDGFRLDVSSSMSQISRDPLELVRQTMSEHQYPDGFVLFLGTPFAPTQDRDATRQGFTHKIGDQVRITAAKLGTLENRITTSKDAPAWTFGIAELFCNLASRGLLAPERDGR